MFMEFNQIETLISIKEIKPTKLDKNREAKTPREKQQVKQRIKHVIKTKGRQIGAD